jgi:GNAT superfamily N-acetyltransferase
MEISLLTPDTPRDVFDRIARLHIQVINEGFLSTVGNDLLCLLYLTAVKSKHAFVFVAWDKEELAGFICGSYCTSRLYTSIVCKLWPSLLVNVVPRFVDASYARKCIEVLVYPARQRQDLPDQEIINFCVAPSRQGQGVGRRLFDALKEQFALHGCTKFKIVTGERQSRAQSFYAAGGAKLVGHRELHRGKKSLVFLCDVSSGGGTQTGMLSSGDGA